nr:DUF2336 domain-containing protein [Rhizomicrobium palustre]
MPVIEYSPQLEDEDLIQLVVASRASKILSAVARRKNLSGDVSEAVATTLDTDAVAALLANTDATIRTKTLDKIISNAAEVAEWHGPLVVRADLSPNAIERIAGFVGSKLIDTLAQRSGLDESVRGELKRRLDEKKKAEAKQDGAESHSETPLTGGALTEAFVFNAVEHCRKDTVVKALALLAKTGEDNVRRILSSQSGAAAVSLVWRAGLSMQVAYRLQVQVMRLSGISLVPARNGSEFPLKSDEMRRQLGNYGIA